MGANKEIEYPFGHWAVGNLEEILQNKNVFVRLMAFLLLCSPGIGVGQDIRHTVPEFWGKFLYLPTNQNAERLIEKYELGKESSTKLFRKAERLDEILEGYGLNADILGNAQVKSVGVVSPALLLFVVKRFDDAENRELLVVNRLTGKVIFDCMILGEAQEEMVIRGQSLFWFPLGNSPKRFAIVVTIAAGESWKYGTICKNYTKVIVIEGFSVVHQHPAIEDGSIDLVDLPVEPQLNENWPQNHFTLSRLFISDVDNDGASDLLIWRKKYVRRARSTCVTGAFWLKEQSYLAMRFLPEEKRFLPPVELKSIGSIKGSLWYSPVIFSGGDRYVAWPECDPDMDQYICRPRGTQ